MATRNGANCLEEVWECWDGLRRRERAGNKEGFLIEEANREDKDAIGLVREGTELMLGVGPVVVTLRGGVVLFEFGIILGGYWVGGHRE